MKIAVTLLLLLPCQIFAQQFVKDLQSDLDAYYQSFMPLKVHVFTNQPEYAAGDTIYFKVNLITAKQHRHLRGKSILSAALLNSNGEKILASSFAISNGHGNNQIILPATLADGVFYLTVWSDWMVANTALQYKKLIVVGNALNSTHTTQKLLASPEGGKLINGLSTRVAVAGSRSAKVRVIENSNEIQNFLIGEEGTASFYLIPKKGSRYEIVSNEDRVLLPDVSDDGISILVTPIPGRNSTRVYLTAPEQSDYRNKTFHLVLSMHGSIHNATEILFKNQSYFTWEIPTHQLPHGIALLTLFDNQRNVIIERLFYNPPAHTITTSMDFEKKRFKTREKINLRLKVSENSAPHKSNLTLTAFSTSFAAIDTASANAITSDLYLSGDLGYDSFLFSSKDNFSSIDTKLMLAKWSRFDWKNLSKRSDNAYYTQYMHFIGKAFDNTTNKPLTDSARITFFMHKNVNTYQAYTNTNGEFLLSMLFEFYGMDEVYYRVEQNGKLLPDARVTITETSIVSPEATSRKAKTSAYSILYDKRRIVSESYGYHTSENRSFVSEETESLIEEEIFGPDVTIKMEDYHLFPTMIETLREVVPYLEHRKIKGKDVVRIFNAETRDYWDGEPVYVIDGVMTDDIDYFLSLNPADISAIKVVHSPDKLRTFGTIGIGGLVIIDTKIPDNNKSVHRSVRTLTLKGLSEDYKKSDVSHEKNPDSRIPDLRTNLAWMPLIETDSNGEAFISFYASDVPGKYRIEGEGISADGKTFFFNDEFEVVFEK
jgi:hypothetical protein